MKTIRLLSILCLLILNGSFVTAQTLKTLDPLTSFGTGGNGRIEPPSSDPFLEGSTNNNQRGFAADPVTGNLVLVNSQSGSGGSFDIRGDIFILDGNSGLKISSLNTNGMSGGTYASSAAAVADDGAVYVCNQVANSSVSTNPFTIYRWSSVNSVDPPTIAFTGTLLPAQRYGATMDARGSGTGTQIIIGCTGTGTTGTNVVIFTTTDGTSFIANVLATDATTANFHDGIAFGAGDTFWAKKVGAPLRWMSFNLTTLTATTLKSFDSTALPGSANLGPISVDNQSNLLAAVEVFANPNNSEKIHLFDISNTNHPVLLDIETLNPNNANSSAPAGFLDFNNGKLYAHIINNGLAGFLINSITPAPPTILTQPAPNTRTTAGKPLTLSVMAYPATSYRWQKNEVDIPGETNASLQFLSIQATNSGTYRVIASNSSGETTSDNAVIAVVNLADLYHLNVLWATAPATGSYVTTAAAGTPNERSIAYNALSNQVYVVQKSGNFYTIHVIDGSTGQKLYVLKTNGIQNVVSEVSGSNPLNLCAIAVGDDGAIYACNETPNAGGGSNPFSTNKYFRVYRWANSDSNTLPTQIFEGDPMGQSANFRWGDVMSIRGGGTNTQIILNNRNNTAHYVAILTPADETMTTWTSKRYFMEETLPFGTTIGRSIEFGVGNTFYQKNRASALLKSGFDPEFNPSIPTAEGTFTGFASTVGGVWINSAFNVAAGLNLQANGTATPDAVNLYDVTDLSSPLLIAQYNFPQNHVDNSNFIGWSVWSGNKLFALAGNNGVVAFELVSGPPGPPVFISNPRNVRVVAGNPASFSVTLDSTAVLQWQKDGTNIPGATALTLTINNAGTNDVGAYRCIATNSFGSSTSTVATLDIANAADLPSLSSLWNAAPESQPYASSTGGSGTPNERTIAYNSLSNQLYVVHRIGSGTAVGTYEIHVVDPNTGAPLYLLNTNGIVHDGTAQGGSSFLAINALGVADDGAIYGANLAPDACSCSTTNGYFRLYRWANSDSNTVPIQVFQGDPAGSLSSLRWGDSIHVRGSGIDTEIVVDANAGNYACVFKPTDSSMTSFTNYWFSTTADGTPIGRSLQFGSGDTIWQKRSGKRLHLTSYNLNGQTSTILSNYLNFPTSLGPVALDFSRQLLAGISFAGTTNAPDTLDLYDVSDFSAPLLIAKYNFPNNSRPNGNFIGQVIFAGNKVFAVDGNNGVVGFSIGSPSGPAISVSVLGSNITLTWPDATYDLQSTPSLSAPVEWTTISTPGQTNVTESMTGAGKFYRLRK